MRLVTTFSGVEIHQWVLVAQLQNNLSIEKKEIDFINNQIIVSWFGNEDDVCSFYGFLRTMENEINLLEIAEIEIENTP